ncbi:unnamed protein product [Callosobruchus maculatus]|uniref:Uncharacterized protein n=1 Tax=Callosobruchus maculatus TaxID=64391 RepID=A0A653CT61_CALMS|nr:unnamed protein product [Callosobruchus maculatus]
MGAVWIRTIPQEGAGTSVLPIFRIDASARRPS